MKKSYKCSNCGLNHTAKYINAMIKAGSELRHLSCQDCGQHTIANAEKA